MKAKCYNKICLLSNISHMETALFKDLSHVCTVPGLFGPGFVRTRVCSVPGLFGPGFVRTRVCSDPGLFGSGFVRTRVCSDPGLLYPDVNQL